MKLNYAPLASWDDFENLCRDLFEADFFLSYVTRYARVGQRQYGVDIFGIGPGRSQIFGIQCKKRERALDLKKDVISEIELARNFVPRLTDYCIATTASRDGKTNDIINQYLSSNRDIPFTVKTYFWEDINDLLNTYPKIAQKYYPPIIPESLPLSFQLGIAKGDTIFNVYRSTTYKNSTYQLNSLQYEANILVQPSRIMIKVGGSLIRSVQNVGFKRIGRIRLNLAEVVDRAGDFISSKETTELCVSADPVEDVYEVVHVCASPTNMNPEIMTRYSGTYYIQGSQAYDDEDLSLDEEQSQRLKILSYSLKNIFAEVISERSLIK